VGEFIEEEQLTIDALKTLIPAVLDNAGYKIQAMRMRAEILAGDGLKRAATILGQSLQESISLRQESRVELAIK
jgi:UDP:flavonoid glycosyltransferase YjiC (YdhE family)